MSTEPIQRGDAETQRSAEFRCLTLLQPWASFVMWGLKTWETRSRNIGIPLETILIHASKRIDEPGRVVYERVRSQFTDRRNLWPSYESLTRGAILGHVDVRSKGNLVPAKLSDLEKLVGDFTEGRWFAQLETPVEWARAIPCSGQRGIWKVKVTV